MHRLDQDTSGVVVMALTPEAAREICRQFRERGDASELMGSAHVVAHFSSRWHLPMLAKVEDLCRQVAL